MTEELPNSHRLGIGQYIVQIHCTNTNTSTSTGMNTNTNTNTAKHCTKELPNSQRLGIGLSALAGDDDGDDDADHGGNYDDDADHGGKYDDDANDDKADGSGFTIRGIAGGGS